ncbi:hypothetical protein DIPPA_30068 [Diplonema papillatum]|nr:hypothetical protein DIPPA_30068 [Diplonema papillatum]
MRPIRCIFFMSAGSNWGIRFGDSGDTTFSTASSDMAAFPFPAGFFLGSFGDERLSVARGGPF